MWHSPSFHPLLIYPIHFRQENSTGTQIYRAWFLEHFFMDTSQLSCQGAGWQRESEANSCLVLVFSAQLPWHCWLLLLLEPTSIYSLPSEFWRALERYLTLAAQYTNGTHMIWVLILWRFGSSSLYCGKQKSCNSDQTSVISSGYFLSLAFDQRFIFAHPLSEYLHNTCICLFRIPLHVSHALVFYIASILCIGSPFPSTHLPSFCQSSNLWSNVLGWIWRIIVTLPNCIPCMTSFFFPSHRGSPFLL